MEQAKLVYVKAVHVDVTIPEGAQLPAMVVIDATHVHVTFKRAEPETK